jgi:FixJ family two-component response regulator
MQHVLVSIIDDDPSVREGAADLLNSAGIATECFDSGDEFLRSDRLASTSCLVTDVRMPGMSGIDLHDSLRQEGKEIPTILITAFPRDVDRVRVRKAGIYGYLTKPFTADELLSCVNSALRREQLALSNYQDVDERPAVAQDHLRIEELSGPDALEAITSEWEKLDAQLSPRTPFTSPLWAKLWWQHLRKVTPAIRHEFFVHTVRDPAGELVAVAPLVITHRPGIGPLRLRLLQFFGAADGSITEHRCIVCREQDEPRIIQTLTNYLHDHSKGWDLFVWTGLRRGCNADGLHSKQQLHIYKTMPYYLVRLPNSWEEFRAGLSPNMKEAIRKCYRHLTRVGHTFSFRVVANSAEISNSLHQLFNLHAERAHFKYAPRHRDLFAEPSHRAFITEVAHRMAEKNQLLIFELEVAGKVVASRMAFLLNDELYLYYSGYDLEWRKHSIMTTLMCECFKWAIDKGITLVNLSKGRDPSKLRWRGKEVDFSDALLMSPTPRGALISRGYNLLKSRPGLFVKLTELLTALWLLPDFTRYAAVSLS